MRLPEGESIIDILLPKGIWFMSYDCERTGISGTELLGTEYDITVRDGRRTITMTKEQVFQTFSMVVDENANEWFRLAIESLAEQSCQEGEYVTT